VSELVSKNPKYVNLKLELGVKIAFRSAAPRWTSIPNSSAQKKENVYRNERGSKKEKPEAKAAIGQHQGTRSATRGIGGSTLSTAYASQDTAHGIRSDAHESTAVHLPAVHPGAVPTSQLDSHNSRAQASASQSAITPEAEVVTVQAVVADVKLYNDLLTELMHYTQQQHFDDTFRQQRARDIVQRWISSSKLSVAARLQMLQFWRMQEHIDESTRLEVAKEVWTLHRRTTSSS
jgi:hypothetical protein